MLIEICLILTIAISVAFAIGIGFKKLKKNNAHAKDMHESFVESAHRRAEIRNSRED